MEKEIDKVFQFNLRRLRDIREWSQRDLALKLGCSLATVKNYENCHRWPGLDMISELARVFMVEETEFFLPTNLDHELFSMIEQIESREVLKKRVRNQLVAEQKAKAPRRSLRKTKQG